MMLGKEKGEKSDKEKRPEREELVSDVVLVSRKVRTIVLGAEMGNVSMKWTGST